VLFYRISSEFCVSMPIQTTRDSNYTRTPLAVWDCGANPTRITFFLFIYYSDALTYAFFAFNFYRQQE